MTARYLTAVYLAKLPYAPHRAHLRISPREHVNFWWSYFPGTVDPDGASICDYSGPDLGYLRFLWKFLQPGMTFFDVGAYHGIYALIAAKKLGKYGRVVAFEPSPDGLRRLRLHLHLNRISSATAENCAITAEEGTAPLFTVLDGHPDMNSLRHSAPDFPVSHTTVATTTLDRYVQYKRINKVDLVKIDTEGAEMDVFRGADRFVHQLRPLIICEVLDQVTRPWGYAAREIVARLQTRDYDWFDIRHDGCLVPHRLQSEYPEVRNYLAIPREKRDSLRRVLDPSAAFLDLDSQGERVPLQMSD